MKRGARRHDDTGGRLRPHLEIVARDQDGAEIERKNFSDDHDAQVWFQQYAKGETRTLTIHRFNASGEEHVATLSRMEATGNG